jgi:xanthine dehydrogenase YagR molybdenum-binding subunit
MPNESLVDRAKETVGIGQTPVTQAAKSGRPLDRESAFDALGVSMVEEYGEWKPDGAPMDSLRAMYKGQMRMVGGSEMKDKIAYAPSAPSSSRSGSIAGRTRSACRACSVCSPPGAL